MSLDAMLNDILLIMFKSLYPPGFFSNVDWLAAYCLGDERNTDDEEDEGQDEEEGQEEEDDEGREEDNEGDDTDLNDDECECEDEDEEDLKTSSSSSSHDFRVTREIARLGACERGRRSHQEPLANMPPTPRYIPDNSPAPCSARGGKETDEDGGSGLEHRSKSSPGQAE